MKALLSFHGLFARQYGSFLTALVLSLVTLLAGVALLGISGWFLTGAFLATAAASFNLFGPSAAVRGLSLLRILSRYGEKLIGHDATLKVLAEIRQWLFQRLKPGVLPPGQSLRHGDAVSRLTADVDALDSIFIVAAGPLLTGVLVAAAITAILMLNLPAAGILYAILMGTALFIVPLLLSKGTRQTGAEIIRLSAELRVSLFDIIDGHADLIAFAAAERARQHSAAVADRLAAARRRLVRAAATASAAITMLAGAAVLGMLLFGLEALEADKSAVRGWSVSFLLSSEVSKQRPQLCARFQNWAVRLPPPNG